MLTIQAFWDYNNMKNVYNIINTAKIKLFCAATLVDACYTGNNKCNILATSDNPANNLRLKGIGL